MPTTTVSNNTNTIDVDIKVLPWYVMILVRVARVYLQTFLGLVTADATGIINLDGLQAYAIAALFPAFMSLAQNAIEVLTKLDVHDRYSTFRA